MEITIRDMKIDDIKECSKLFFKVFTKAPWFDKWESLNTAEKYLSEFIYNPLFLGYVIEKDKQIVGASLGHTRSWYDGKEYCIDEFFIDDEIHGLGLGTKLMDGIKERISLNNINCIFLLTERGIPAEEFYKKNGFKIKENSLFMYSIF